jgi:hypothetical protein
MIAVDNIEIVIRLKESKEKEKKKAGIKLKDKAQAGNLEPRSRDELQGPIRALSQAFGCGCMWKPCVGQLSVAQRRVEGARVVAGHVD